MKPVEIDDAFYQGKALLLVEDHLTRRVVAKCWESHPRAKDIQVRAAGGSEGVSALVDAARQRGRKDVFGLLDRDFGVSGAGGGAFFRTAGHEVENHLLDFEVLARLAAVPNTAAEIEAEARRYAGAMVPWMALRQVLFELRRDRPGFPPDPPIAAVASLDSARAWLGAQKYPEKNEQWVGRVWMFKQLATILGDRHETYANDVAGSAWLTTFSGKELFRHVRASYRWRAAVECDEDLAFEVAERWARAGRSPAFLDAVRDGVIAGFRR